MKVLPPRSGVSSLIGCRRSCARRFCPQNHARRTPLKARTRARGIDSDRTADKVEGKAGDKAGDKDRSRVEDGGSGAHSAGARPSSRDLRWHVPYLIEIGPLEMVGFGTTPARAEISFALAA